MIANILDKILNLEISVDQILDWLTTADCHDVIFSDIEQTEATRIEFILYFLDYVRKECQGILHFADNDGSEIELRKPSSSVSELNKNVNPGNDKLQNTSKLKESSIDINVTGPHHLSPSVISTSLNSLNSTTSNVQLLTSSSPTLVQIDPGMRQYESPLSHSSPLRSDSLISISMHEKMFPYGECTPYSHKQTQKVPGALQCESPQFHSDSLRSDNSMSSSMQEIISPKSHINNSHMSNSSVVSGTSCSPIPPDCINQVASNKSSKKKNNKSRESFNKTNSQKKEQNAKRSICLGDFITKAKSNSKQNNKSNLRNQSVNQSSGELNTSIEAENPNKPPQKHHKSKRRINPTKIVINNCADNPHQEIFGVVSRPLTTNPQFSEAFATVETTQVTSFHDERELLKLQRQNQSNIVPIVDTTQQELVKNSMKPKHTSTVALDLNLVEYMNILKILAELYGGLLIKNLIPNPMTELYFIISLITCQYKVNNTITQSHSKLCNKTELLEQLKETMGCSDLIDDSSEEHDELNEKNCINEHIELSGNELNAENNTQSIISQQKYFYSAHNCVYFAVSVLWNARNLLSVFDRPTLALLYENTLVKTFHPSLHEFSNKLYDEKCLQSKYFKPYNYSRTIQSNVCFQVDTDNRNNFLSTFEFSSFCKQRDLFYEILKIWEDGHMMKKWSFQLMLKNKIHTLLSMNSDVVNYYHIARLFKSQLLLSSIKIGQTEDNFHNTNLDVLKSFKDLNPEKLQQLQQRLITPVSSTGPVPLPSFPGVQEFYKQFLVTSENPRFLQILQDSFIQEIMALNDTQFTCSDIDRKESQVDENTKQNYLLCVSSLRLMAKFLGFLISLPYQSRLSNTMKSETMQIALRSRIMPPLDLRECLYQALVNKKLSLTVPWIVQYLAMLDTISFRLPYYLNICGILYCIYREMQYSLHNEVALLVTFSIGWLFELPNFPKDIYCNWFKNFEVQRTELRDDIVIYRRKKAISMTDDTNGTLDKNNIIFNELNIIDDRALYICCPYLKELKLLLTSGNSNPNSNNANRHITPVSSKLSQTSNATKIMSLELQLEEAFFHGHPQSVRRTVDFTVERITSNCIKFICHTIIPSVKQKYLSSTKTKGNSKNDIAKIKSDLIDVTTTKIREQSYEIIPEMCENKTKSAIKLLLADEISTTAKEMCIKIAIRMEIEQIYQWLDSYINSATTKKEIFLKVDSLRIDSDDEDDEEDENKTFNRTKKIETFDPDEPCATSVIHDTRSMIWELIENNRRWSILTEEMILLNVDKIYHCLHRGKNMEPFIKKIIYQMSVDCAIHLIALKFNLFTPNVEKKFFEIWLMNDKNNDSNIKLFSGLLSPRNVTILMQNKDNTVWIKYGKFIQQILKQNLISIHKFSNDCVSLLKHEWSPNILKSLAKCITEAIYNYKHEDESVNKVMLLLDWIIQTCGTMEDYD